VVDYDEPTIRQALERLDRKRWARLASGPGSRAAKYRHLLDDALRLEDDEISLLAVLMLRGPQTAAELKQRAERLHRFDSTPGVEQALHRLTGRELVRRLDRRPGQKEERWEQLLGGGGSEDTATPARPPSSSIEDRVAALEREVAELRELLGRHD
jgi:hypothetical protein